MQLFIGRTSYSAYTVCLAITDSLSCLYYLINMYYYFVMLCVYGKSSTTTHLWRRSGERTYTSYSFTNSTQDRVSGQRQAPAALNPQGKDSGTHWTGSWVGPRAGLDIEDRGIIYCLCRGSNLDRLVVQPVARHYTG
jgi:hypothetical protein